jgi:DNA mismatch endonuclease, patch repair protein
MSRIRSKNTKPEMIVRKYLHGKGLRYSLHNGKLPGKPDIVLKKYKTIINVNGCFWHGHEDCKYFVVPKSRTEWWLKKINKTITRDKWIREELELLGWKVLSIWECKLKPTRRTQSLEKLYQNITD